MGETGNEEMASTQQQEEQQPQQEKVVADAGAQQEASNNAPAVAQEQASNNKRASGGDGANGKVVKTPEVENMEVLPPEENGNLSNAQKDNNSGTSATTASTKTPVASSTETVPAPKHSDTVVIPDGDKDNATVEEKEALVPQNGVCKDPAGAEATTSAEAQPLAIAEGAQDIEKGQSTKSKLPEFGRKQLMRILKKREILLCFIGVTTFLIGLILIIIGLMVMQSKCDRNQANHHDGHTVMVAGQGHGDVTYVHSHAHDHEPVNVTEETTKNLAEGRVAYQSSTNYKGSMYFNASLAVDGSLHDRVHKGWCAQTDFEEGPYWYVDLGAPHMVNKVKILAPGDCCVGELHDFEVRTGLSQDMNQNKLCKHFMGTALKTSINIKCDSKIYGRYVGIRMLGDDVRRRDRLTLCEILVYAG